MDGDLVLYQVFKLAKLSLRSEGRRQYICSFASVGRQNDTVASRRSMEVGPP